MFQNDSLFGRFMNLMFDVICIGLMWVISSIPLVTMGTATTAAYYTMAKCVRYKSGYVTKEFFSAFRKNFRQTIGFNVLFLFLFLMLAVELKFAWDQEGRLGSSLFIGLVFVLFLVLGICMYLYPVLSRFYMNNLTLIKSSFLMMGLAVAVLGIYFMNWAVFFLPGLCIYGLTFPMEWMLRKMMPEVPKDSEEAQKWYYR